jgi:hypothetical protein
MKRCPQCNSVFDDRQDFCANDGSALIDEHFVLPSEASANDTEEETVVRHEPIRIEIPNTVLPAEAPENQLPPTPQAFLLFQNRNSNPERPVENVQLPASKHAERNPTRNDAEFNGFVLSEAANIRSSPGSAVLDSLPKNDRLEILERDNAWYRVVCEHGIAGWMHGNTIRFNDDAAPF